MERRILLVGGGSGGHVYPLVAVAESLKKKASSLGIKLKLLIIGGGKFTQRAAEESKIDFKIISTGKLRRYGSMDNLFDIWRFFLGVIQSLWHVFWFMPDAVFAKGGADSVAPSLISWLFFIPVYIHESDSVPGLANTILGKVATKVFVSFQTAEKYFLGSKVILTGNPVRENLLIGDKDQAWKYFNFHERRPTILILGGSLGAKVINEVITSSLVVMTEKFNVIHQCGESQFDSVKTEVDTVLKEGTQQYAEPIAKYYRLYPFLNQEELSLAYSVADIIISRAGAGLLFEIARLGKPAIIIPISKSASNHQQLNAFEFSLYGAHLLEEKDLNRESLMREVENMLNPENYAKISEKIKTFSSPGAADKIVEEMTKSWH